MKHSYNYIEEISLLEIKYRLIRNKNLIFIFSFFSLILSAIFAFNQKISYEGKIYFSSNPTQKTDEKYKKSIEKLKLDSEAIAPSLRPYIFNLPNIKDLNIRRENIISELALNPVIMERAYLKIKKNKLIDKNRLISFNNWANNFNLSGDKNLLNQDTIFRELKFGGRNKELVKISLNRLKEEILNSKEYRNQISNRPQIDTTFFGPTIIKIDPINKFKIIFSGMLFGISIIILFCIYKESLSRIISNQKIFIDLIPYPLMRNFSSKKIDNWEKGIRLMQKEIQNNKNFSKIYFTTISKIYPKELDILKNIFNRIYKEYDFIISNNLTQENNSLINILVVYPNKITEEDLLIVKQDLNNSKIKTIGWIYIN